MPPTNDENNGSNPLGPGRCCPPTMVSTAHSNALAGNSDTAVASTVVESATATGKWWHRLCHCRLFSQWNSTAVHPSVRNACQTDVNRNKQIEQTQKMDNWMMTVCGWHGTWTIARLKTFFDTQQFHLHSSSLFESNSPSFFGLS